MSNLTSRSHFPAARITAVLKVGSSRFTRPEISWRKSLREIIHASWINSFILFLPVAMAVYFVGAGSIQSNVVVFALCFFSIVALESFIDFGGEQLAIYTGDLTGNLIVTTLKNIVEATVAIILLIRCELRLLQSTVIGVVLLHLLLAPGISFLTGGSSISKQCLDSEIVRLNRVLLITAVAILVIPVIIFAAMTSSGPQPVLSNVSNNVPTDSVRDDFLRITHGIAIIMFVVYMGTRTYLHHPFRNDRGVNGAPSGGLSVPIVEVSSAFDGHPSDNAHSVHDGAHGSDDSHRPLLVGATADASNAEAGRSNVAEHPAQSGERRPSSPKANECACIILLATCVPLMIFTVECLLDSIDFVRERSFAVREEWFGLILLPLISYAADGLVTIGFFVRSLSSCFVGQHSGPSEGKPPKTLAEDRAIDMSIQFTLMWLPIFVIISWASEKPLTLLFDVFEVSVLITACFLVNYVTAEGQTTWAGGLAMISFYVIIALCAWNYGGQPAIKALSACGETGAQVAISSTRMLETGL